jgi:hypothetical protein
VVPFRVEPDPDTAEQKAGETEAHDQDAREVDQDMEIDQADRILLMDDADGSLAEVALRITRLGFDLHYTKDLDEAHLLVEQEIGRVGALLVPPTVNPEEAADVLEYIRKGAFLAPPSFVVLGASPDESVRKQFREAGARWSLWIPFDDSELRCFLAAALTPPERNSRRLESRVPVNLTAWVRAQGRNEGGVVTSLSARGAFVAVPDPLPPDTPLRLEIELDRGRLRVFGRVIYARSEGLEDGPLETRGMGIVFYGVDRATQTAIQEFVEERVARYRL